MNHDHHLSLNDPRQDDSLDSVHGRRIDGAKSLPRNPTRHS